MPNGKQRRPPPPPQSLIQLLRTDASVLDYFNSLQVSLDSDVQKWKERAEHYKNECRDLKRKLAATQKHKASEEEELLAASRKRKANERDEEANEQDGEATHEARVRDNGKKTSVAAIDDSMFVFSSDDDEDDDVEDAEQQHVDQAGPGFSQGKSETSWRTYERLCEAYNILQRFGVALVTEEVVGKEQDTQESEDIDGEGCATWFGAELSNRHGMKATPKFLRRSDQEVAADMMHAFHTVTRIQLHMKDATVFPPFLTDHFIPCCNKISGSDNVHPAVEAKESALQALLVMDLYCTPTSDSEWVRLFPVVHGDVQLVEAIRVGMRDRRQLVDALLSSLSGEICDTWAIVDRSSRLITTALHYQATPDDEISPYKGEFGAKSQARLSSLAERCLLAQIASGIHYIRDDPQEATRLSCRYILSAAPSLGVEDYPRLPPAMSLCVLEGLLCRDSGSPRSSTLSQISLMPHLQSLGVSGGCKPSLFIRGVALAVHASAQVWKMRLASSDDRISDVSNVEVSCYNRLLESQHSWLSVPGEDKSLYAYREQATILLGDTINHADTLRRAGGEVPSTVKAETFLAAQLALVVLGDMRVLENTFDSIASSSFDGNTSWLPVAFCAAFKHIQVRQMDAFRLKQGSLLTAPSVSTSQAMPQKVTRVLDALLERTQASPDLVGSIINCCLHLSDAEYIYKLMLWVAKQDLLPTKRVNLSLVISNCIGTPFSALPAPTVRVINLQRRSDRMSSFMAQAQSEHILVSKAVARFDSKLDQHSEQSPLEDVEVDGDYLWGRYAFDGQGRMAEAEARLSKEIGEGRQLSTFVETHWRPNDLKAFDKDARDDEALVRISPSETACALSHIASWKGVCRSLIACPMTQADPISGQVFHNRDSFLTSFTISGYARGKALLHTNEQMPPTPVCVILEDDAILVDRFVDRLSALLEELPRDFHFCSVGFSRPKTAPIAKYSSQLGIPSCIWYLTGYVLSLEGARHLLNSLPVRGPVDSWIGLKMCANWDNVFGQAMGVGNHAAPTVELPARKDLARILQFRAFAALVPLCNQKVGTTTNITAARSWRQRDTDITYSGNL